MTFERVIGRVEGGGGDVDWVDIDWSQTARRALRLTSRAGRRVNVLLPRDHPTLRDGDVLARAAEATIAIRVRAESLLRLRPATMHAMGLLCAELGNGHVPLEIAGADVITLDDGPARELADRLAIERESFRDAFHPLRSSCLAAELARIGASPRVSRPITTEGV